MKELNNVIREEFLLLTEKLKLDTGFWSQSSGVESLEAELNNRLAQYSGEICVGPYMLDWRPLTLTLPLKGGGKGGGERLSDKTLESLVDVYKKLFLPDRQIRFIGVDLDDCLYDVTPIRQLLVQKINQAVGATLAVAPNRAGARPAPTIAWALYNAYKDDLEAEDIRKQKALTVLKQSNAKEIVERTYHAYKDFSRLDNPNIRALYKPYEGVKDTLRHLIESGNFIVGILTNGPSKFQRDKINLLGLKEGEHFNFVMVSDDIGIGKPSRKFFELAKQKASQLRNAECGMRNYSELRTPNSELRNEECLILEDQVKNLSGADGWLKVQFLRGYHSNIQPENVQEIPKYGVTKFSNLLNLLNLEKDNGFQAMAGSYFILKSLLLLAPRTSSYNAPTH